MLSLPETQMAGTVAAYYSIGTEPDTHGLVFALWKRGSYVLLPVLLPDGDLDWASYEGPDSLRPGPRGLPSRPSRRAASTAITSADLVLVPALAVDHSGSGSAAAAAPTTARWPGSVRRYRPLRCCMTASSWTHVPAGPHDQPVRLVARPPGSGGDQAAPGGMSYHLAVVDGEC